MFRIFPKFYARRKGDLRKVAVAILLCFIIALIFSAQFRYELRSLLEYPLHYKEYKQFGIRIPGQYSIHGIDVSKWQSRVDWERIKKMKVGDIQITFAFMKATEGSWMKDPEFDRNWENAKRNGLTRGAYHFFWPSVSVKDQAFNFIKTVTLKSGDLPPVIDVEETKGMTKAQIQKNTKEFLNIIEKHYKVKPILYTNRDFYKNYFSENEDFKNYRFWIAHYHVSDLEMPGDAKWHFWQHSDRGNVNGINEKVDFNVFYGDAGDFKKILITDN